MAPPNPRIPVFLLTGFLGSGKTTLLNALLREPAFANTAVIVNEFGEIGLDHFLIERSQDNVVLLDAGCLCCTISDSLHETLADLYSRRIRGEVPAFARVVVETTGLAEPAPILNTLLGHSLIVPNYRLEATVVTVDALHAGELLDAQPEVAHQIAVADRLLLTKTDLASVDTGLVERLRELNAFAPLIESVSGARALEAFATGAGGRVPIADRVARTAGPPSLAQHCHDERHDHDHRPSSSGESVAAHPAADRNRHDAHIRAHCLVIDDPVSWSGIAAWWQWMVESLGDRMLRCKGLFRIAETGEIVFVQGVQRVFHRPERLAVWPDDDPRSRLVCIARDTAEHEVCQTLAALGIASGSDPRAALAQLRTHPEGTRTTASARSGTIG